MLPLCRLTKANAEKEELVLTGVIGQDFKLSEVDRDARCDREAFVGLKGGGAGTVISHSHCSWGLGWEGAPDSAHEPAARRARKVPRVLPEQNSRGSE